jgi:hypothetical protein
MSRYPKAAETGLTGEAHKSRTVAYSIKGGIEWGSKINRPYQFRRGIIKGGRITIDLWGGRR